MRNWGLTCYLLLALPTVSGVQTILVVWLRVAWRSKYCRCMAHPGSVYDEVARCRLNRASLLAVDVRSLWHIETTIEVRSNWSGGSKKETQKMDTVQIRGEATCRNVMPENFGQARGSPIQLSEGKDGETSEAEADPILMLVIWWHPMCKLIEALAVCLVHVMSGRLTST